MMDSNEKMQMAKTITAAGAGISVTAADINTYLQIALASASLVYVVAQIYWGYHKHRNRK